MTIAVAGDGGTTVAGGGGDSSGQATSICSSLSSEACGDLKPTACESLGEDSSASSTKPIAFWFIFLYSASSIIENLAI